jgi:serine/threonine-protein kinase
MRWLSDTALDRLREAAEWPDLTGTRYQAIEQIGQGGMATVFRVRDTVLDRFCAMKVLRLPDDASGIGPRLRLESRILADLEHPGIVPIHDAGELPDGRPYYVMKFVRGRRLDDVVHDGVDLAERLRIFERVCEAVAFAHSCGVIHRDLKPENVMTGEYGEVLALDWGVARVLVDRDELDENRDTRSDVDGEAENPVTRHGTVLGTPGYMAPEQASGESGEIGPTTDVYALGGILWFLLSGEHPFADPAAYVPPLSGSVPVRLIAISHKARALSPGDRYASVDLMAADIRRFLEGSAVGAYRETLWDRLGRLAHRHRVAILLVLAYLLLRVALLFFGRR